MQSHDNSNQLVIELTMSKAATGGGTYTTLPDDQAADPMLLPSSVVADNKDDLDILLLHEDFPVLLTLVANVKKSRAMSALGPPDLTTRPQTGVAADRNSQLMDAVERFHIHLLLQESNEVIRRGMFPITDSVMDDALSALQAELESYETESMDGNDDTSSTARSKKEAIAIKYSKRQTDILMNWMIEHIDQPFPDAADVQKLIKATGLSQSQVVNWTTNVRKRNRKATCEGGKKPHHFIDFLFLKQDREKRVSNLLASPVRSTMQPSTRLLPPTGFRSKVPPTIPEWEELAEISETLSVGSEQEHDLLIDFADFWLRDVDPDEVSTTTTPMGVVQPLLPSVTHDSHDDHRVSLHKRVHEEDEDIYSWAAEMGLHLDL